MRNPVFDQKTQQLYLSIFQVFHLFFVPVYKAKVNLVTVLQLTQDESSGKYFIQSQHDLYQFNEFVKFVWPGGATVLWVWQQIATLVCVIGSLLLAPVTRLEQKLALKKAQ